MRLSAELFITLSIVLAAATAQAKIDDRCAIRPMDSGRGGGACFTGETLVATPSGQKPISEFRPGDQILSMDTNGKVVKSVVTDAFAHLKRNTCTLRMTDGSQLRVTPEHVFMYVDDTVVVTKDLSKNIQTERIGALSEIHDDYRSLLNKLALSGYRGQSSLLKLSEVREGSDISTAQRPKAISYDGAENETVYNVEVEKYHNYFANGILVHNIK